MPEPTHPAAQRLPAAAHHRISVQAPIGAMLLDVAFDLTAPWTVLFGPSGSGKSTILRALCGHLPRHAGSVSFLRRSGNDDDWIELAERPPHRRALAYAPQGAALFPHLTVAQNVRFPATVCDVPPTQATLIDDALSVFRLHALKSRHPRELSGGERQRVALARAFATPSACLMLLDEPFTGLDRKLRDELLPVMRQQLIARNIPCLSVTHDVDEALLLDAEVIRLDNGRIVSQGPASDVLSADRERLRTILT